MAVPGLTNLVRSCALGNPAVANLATSMGRRAFASSIDDNIITVEVAPFSVHRIEPPSRNVDVSIGELAKLYHLMFKMRKMEVAIDEQYKARLVRGFCHLYDGQEAVLSGIESAITQQDSLITSYRDHCHMLTRGGTVADVVAELLGRATGATKGVGGSMHMYNRKHNFYGGNGIVGAQIPLGAGIALAHKYRKEPNVCVAMYGDGAANQGQKFEALNMAGLWNIPCIFVCENNHYGMGTAEWRSAKSPLYYTRGDYIPGIKADGMDVLAVKQVIAFAKKHALEHGPIIVELDTYRYRNHSTSDPGKYREHSEVANMRYQRDPIERVKKLLAANNYPADELKRMEREVKAEVEAAVEAAKAAPVPPLDWVSRNVYVDVNGTETRMPMGDMVKQTYMPPSDYKNPA